MLSLFLAEILLFGLLVTCTLGEAVQRALIKYVKTQVLISH